NLNKPTADTRKTVAALGECGLGVGGCNRGLRNKPIAATVAAGGQVGAKKSPSNGTGFKLGLNRRNDLYEFFTTSMIPWVLMTIWFSSNRWKLCTRSSWLRRSMSSTLSTAPVSCVAGV